MSSLPGCIHMLCHPSLSVLDEVSRVLPSLVMVDRASSRPKVAAHVTGSFLPKLEREGGGESGLDLTCKSNLQAAVWFEMCSRMFPNTEIHEFPQGSSLFSLYLSTQQRLWFWFSVSSLLQSAEQNRTEPPDSRADKQE